MGSERMAVAYVQVHLVRAPEKLLQKEKQKNTAQTETVVQRDVEMAE